MANIYDEREKVLANNPPEFIKDFKRVRDIVVLCKVTDYYFATLKNEVWRAAKHTEIRYLMSKDVYVNERQVMVII